MADIALGEMAARPESSLAALTRMNPYIEMRRDVSGRLDSAIWPEGTKLKCFAEGCALESHGLLELAYRVGGGSVSAFREWWTLLSHDAEYDPTLCFPVYSRTNHIVGFAQCWRTGFVEDLAVHPDHRRQGIGKALLTHIFQVFQRREVKVVSLKVEATNPSGATNLYEKLGMRRLAGEGHPEHPTKPRLA